VHSFVGKEGPITRALLALILEDMKSGPPAVRVPVPWLHYFFLSLALQSGTSTTNYCCFPFTGCGAWCRSYIFFCVQAKPIFCNKINCFELLIQCSLSPVESEGIWCSCIVWWIQHQNFKTAIYSELQITFQRNTCISSPFPCYQRR
jgi:hypothetical protein